MKTRVPDSLNPYAYGWEGISSQLIGGAIMTDGGGRFGCDMTHTMWHGHEFLVTRVRCIVLDPHKPKFSIVPSPDPMFLTGDCFEFFIGSKVYIQQLPLLLCVGEWHSIEPTPLRIIGGTDDDHRLNFAAGVIMSEGSEPMTIVPVIGGILYRRMQ